MSTSFIPIQRGHFNLPKRNDLSLPKVLILDMNSFFASVEQQANPSLRGRPVGVVASMHPTSCLIAASKEAKAMGIKTGTLIKYAKEICPNLVLMNSEPEKYREVSRGFNKILQDYSDRIEPYSIDESFVDLRGTKHNPLVVGAEIKQRIKAEVGESLTCNIGIGANKFLAKLAAEMKKPDGLSIVWREHLASVYKDMKFSDLWGIARGWTKRLAALNIMRPGQLLNYPVQRLISIYGKPGFYIWRRVNGLEEDIIENSNIEYRNPKQYSIDENINDQNGFENSNFDHLNLFRISDFEFRISPPKSFGHSWVLNFRTTDKTRLAPVILRLAEKAARRMRRENFWSFGIYLGVRCVDDSGFHKHKKLKYGIIGGKELYQEALLMWKHWRITGNVSHIAVGFTDLKRNYKQPSLFDNKDQSLTQAIDYINNKYGEFMIRSGILTHSRDYAPDAIAFGK